MAPLKFLPRIYRNDNAKMRAGLKHATVSAKNPSDSYNGPWRLFFFLPLSLSPVPLSLSVCLSISLFYFRKQESKAAIDKARRFYRRDAREKGLNDISDKIEPLPRKRQRSLARSLARTSPSQRDKSPPKTDKRKS